MKRNHAFLMDEKGQLTNIVGFIRNRDLSGFMTALNGMDLQVLNRSTFEGYTLMQHSVIHGYNEFVNSLLSLNVNGNIGNGLMKPVLLAAAYGHWKILKSFMDLRWQREKKCLIRFDVWEAASEENVLHLGIE